MHDDATIPGVTLAAASLTGAAGLPAAWLGPLERERAAAYNPGTPRWRFTAGRLLARSLVASILSLPAETVGITNECPRCGPGAHGRPVLDAGGEPVRASFSLSRASDWLLVALGPRDSRLGVDLADASDAAFAEAPDREALDELSFSASERSWLGGMAPQARPGERARLWALKEALGKALGAGIAGPEGVPAVNGAGVHRALRLSGARKWSPAGGTAGLPEHLVAGVVLLPPPNSL